MGFWVFLLVILWGFSGVFVGVFVCYFICLVSVKNIKIKNMLIMEEFLAQIQLCSGNETVIFEDIRERNVEIPARSDNNNRLTLVFFRGNTFNSLVIGEVYVVCIFL